MKNLTWNINYVEQVLVVPTHGKKYQAKKVENTEIDKFGIGIEFEIDKFSVELELTKWNWVELELTKWN